ncbi:hypothetical protein KLP40_10515 [Hymenobacter sp. NST-14]|uniref:hypothetical protein n=1 Tax=Hymenobacter piscis TaxID=2839984 RepID=UPI001C023614|nr:hypothetical protein [Hymenobacter piscis]MBT9393594.1 hypothetical protein [Hymenobacter piscis]
MPYLPFTHFVAHGQRIEGLYQHGDQAAIVRKAAIAKKRSRPEAYRIGCAYFQLGQDALADLPAASDYRS